MLATTLGDNKTNDVTATKNGTSYTYTYDSWGMLLSTTGSLATTVGAANPLRYRGYYYDTETGLYYLQTRYYDPQVGRFVSADTYASTGQGIVGFNMYAYCLNCPVMYVDTQGGTAEDIIDDEPDDVEPYRDPSVGAAGNPAYQAGGSSGTPQGGNSSGNGGATFSLTAASGGSHQVISGDTSEDKHEIHHIVERCQMRRSGFSEEDVNGSGNLVSIPREMHRKISAHYSSLYDERVKGITVRDCLTGMSFEEQFKYGMMQLERFWRELYG